MSEHLMDADALERVTGKKRYSKQAEWFKEAFGIDVLRCSDGSIVMPWATFTALNDQRAGLTATESAPAERPKVYSFRKA